MVKPSEWEQFLRDSQRLEGLIKAAEKGATDSAEERRRDADQQARERAERDRIAWEMARPQDKLLGPDPAASIVPGSGQRFRDVMVGGQPCDFCPELVVAPAGSFSMGSPGYEAGRRSQEDQVKVTIARPFAVSRFAITFDQWDACVADGGCYGYQADDNGWGRSKLPVINVNWYEAISLTVWLQRKTGRRYRLLSDSEREYVARAGTTTPFWWGADISMAVASTRI